MATPGGDAGRSGDAARRPTLGAVLRAARGSESLRELGRRTGISTSALSAYERSERVPPRQFLEVLDGALDQHGGLLAHARFDDWSTFEDPGTTHRWVIPATWTGPIWCCVRSADGFGEGLFRWGPWARRVPDEGEAVEAEATFSMVVNRFEGGVGDDRVLSFRSTEPCWVFWGTGQPWVGLAATDIAEGWFPHEDGDLLRLAGQLLVDALAHCGRTTAELAEFLGVEVEVVDALASGTFLSASAGARPR